MRAGVVQPRCPVIYLGQVVARYLAHLKEQRHQVYLGGVETSGTVKSHLTNLMPGQGDCSMPFVLQEPEPSSLCIKPGFG